MSIFSFHATSHIIQFFIQFIILILFIVYFYYNGLEIQISYKLIYIPLLIFQMAILSIGFGTLIASITFKYRDLIMALTFLLFHMRFYFD